MLLYDPIHSIKTTHTLQEQTAILYIYILYTHRLDMIDLQGRQQLADIHLQGALLSFTYRTRLLLILYIYQLPDHCKNIIHPILTTHTKTN